MREQPDRYVRILCPFGHDHGRDRAGAEACCDEFDKLCEWNDPADGIFRALPDKGDGA